jgi:hypothetical protein
MWKYNKKRLSAGRAYPLICQQNADGISTFSIYRMVAAASWGQIPPLLSMSIMKFIISYH